MFFFHIYLIHTWFKVHIEIHAIHKVFLKKSPKWLLTSSSTFGTFVLKLPLFELPQIFFQRLPIVSSFWNHKYFSCEFLWKGLRFKKRTRKCQILGWHGRFSWTGHVIVFFLLTRRRCAGPLHRCVRIALYSFIYSVSSLDLFMKLKYGVTRKS